MTLDLNQILARLAAATPGPWKCHDFGYEGMDEPVNIVVHAGEFDWHAIDNGEFIVATPTWDHGGYRNADMIAHAPTDIAALLAEVERLRENAHRLAPCDMRCEEPYDFAWCETHDSTFPLGGKCRFNGREPWEVYAEEAQDQRRRAVTAEIRAEVLALQIERIRKALGDDEGDVSDLRSANDKEPT